MTDGSEKNKGPNWISSEKDVEGEINPEFVKEMVEANRTRELKWALEHPIGKRLAEMYAGEVHDFYDVEGIQKVVERAKDVIELTSFMKPQKGPVKPETVKKLKNLKEAIENKEAKLREGLVGTSTLSAPEDMLPEIEEMYTPVIARLNDIISKIDEEKPEQSVSYLVNESIDDMKALFEAMVDVGKYYQDQFTARFMSFRRESIANLPNRSREKISDIGLGKNGDENAIGMNNFMYNTILNAHEDLSIALKESGDRDWADMGAELFVESVQLQIDFLRGIAADKVTAFNNMSEPGVRDPLGKTKSEKMKRTLEYLHFTLIICEQLKHQAWLLKETLKNQSE